MKFIDKLERKFGRFGGSDPDCLHHRMLVLGYFLAMFAPGVFEYAES